MKESIEKYFNELEDPRVQGRCKYPLEEMLLVALTSVLCGGRGYQDMQDYGEDLLPFLKKIYPFKNGIPKHDTFRDLFVILEPKTFESCFRGWTEELKETIGDAIAIDGKCLRGSRSKGKNPVTMMSAWCHENNLIIGQLATENKSNEIKAIPKLLELLDIKKKVITMDAMGCQREIASQIIDKKGDYICSLKGNQGTLHKDVKVFFEAHEDREYKDGEFSFEETWNKGRGRKETRKYTLTKSLDWSLESHNWPGLKGVGRVISTREINGKITEETRYFITSLDLDIDRFSRSVRAHWGIENKVHWQLDVNFLEDAARIRKGNGTENLAMIRRHAINLIKKNGDTKRSMRRNMNKSFANNKHLLQIIFGKF